MVARHPLLAGFIAFSCAASLVLTPALAAAQGAGGAKPVTPEKELVAVLDFEAVNTDKVQASALTDKFREELLRSGRFTLVERAQMNQILDEQAFQQSGCTSSDCAVKVGKVLGVRKIIAGKVTRLDDTLWLLSATMVDVETAETNRAESFQHEGNFRTLLSGGVGRLATQMSRDKGDIAAMAAAMPLPAGQQPEAKEGGGIRWYWWALGGLALVGVAAAASGGGGSSSKKSSGGGSSCTTCGSVGVSW
jgi:TolB-like protein